MSYMRYPIRQVSTLLILTILSSGCYTWTAIKPTELPKLNGAQTATSQPTGSQVELVSVAQVETPDGRLAQIRGESDARIQLKGSTPILFEHPIISSVENEDLTIRSGNRAKTSIPLGNIQSLEVSQLNRNQTALAGTVLGLVGSALLGFLIISAIK
jgi:hypothetical protein